MNYKEAYAWQYKNYKNDFLLMIQGQSKPYRIGLYFYRDSHRKADYVNIAQIVFDLMQAYEWLANDDMDTVVPVFLGYEYNPSRAGVEITLVK